MSQQPSKCTCATFTNTHGDLIRHVDQLCPQHGRRATEPDIGRLLAIEAAARDVCANMETGNHDFMIGIEDAPKAVAAIEALRKALGQ